MLIFLVALAASIATFIGGSFALRFRDKLHLILGFSAGAVAGVALFDLLPEAISLGTKYHSAATVALAVALGLFGYLVLDRLILLHTHPSTGSTGLTTSPLGAGEEAGETNAHRGSFGALTLSAHSFLDGIVLGVGFQVSAAVGIVVTAAVLTHDFSDGINTVNLVLRNSSTPLTAGGGSPDVAGRGADWERRLWRRAFRWLLVDAAAPVLGAASTLLFRIPESVIGLVLAVFAGSFLYLSSSDLIPESYHSHPRALTTVMTLLGAALIYAVVHVV